MKRQTPTPTLKLAAGLLCFLGLAVASALAIDPEPDVKTLIMPNLVPKGGQTPGDTQGNESGKIRIAYETTFEDYWKETSYFKYNLTNGVKERGFYTDTKTYGYVSMQWPISSRTNMPQAFAEANPATLFFGDEASAEKFNEGLPPPQWPFGTARQPPLDDG
ncbi:MAG: hypothetical protein GWM98_22995, partial [Nitrospinaceae bacterium]|nr:hypothetical protein [Nitrospinaceae bacterium]